MISAYNRYIQSHEMLFTAATTEEMLNAAGETVENYLDNRAMWDELNYYKQHGVVLGKHPVFKQISRIDEIRNMTTPDLVRLKKSLENNIARTKKNVKDNPGHDYTAERVNRIESFEKELIEVNRRLGF